MTRLRRVFQTTAFKLASAYLIVFAAFAAFLIVYISYHTSIILGGQLREALIEETRDLANIYRRGGIRSLVSSIDRRSRRPGANLYLVTDLTGRPMAGNVLGLSQGVLDQAGIHETEYESLQSGDEDHAKAIVRVFVLQSGFRLLVGRDIGERIKYRHIIRRAILWSVAVMIGLAAASWFFVSRRVLQRIDSVSASSRQIMAGDLSERIEVAGTGDEFDRLAESLNAMLERIEQLMLGLKTVSDNIAHDLKTPLTRLRNRVEDALRRDPSEESYRETLEATIQESDQLIRTFNALLLISRVEAGSPDGVMTLVDVGVVVRDLAELYEPVAEEADIELSTEIGPDLTIRANRELVGQALSNLIDNALKYAGENGTVKPKVQVTAARFGDHVRLAVIDNGPGIPAEDQDRVLDRFVRLEASRSQPGSGLGLSLVAAVAQMHHGRLQLLDADPGLKAVLELPRETGAQE